MPKKRFRWIQKQDLYDEFKWLFGLFQMWFNLMWIVVLWKHNALKLNTVKKKSQLCGFSKL